MAWIRLVERYRSWILSSGAGKNPDTESQNRFFHYSVFLLLGLPTMLAFGWHHLNAGNYQLSLMVFASGISLAVGWRYLWRTGSGVFFYRFNAFLFGLLLLYLLTIGGVGGSMILWTYTFPLITLFLLGKREGLLWNLGLFLSSLIALFSGLKLLAVYAYPAEFKLRFVITYLIVSSIAFWFEYLRDKYRFALEGKARLLEEEKQLLQENVQQLIQAEKEKDFLIETLRNSIEEIQTLRGLLPICCYCNKIRDDHGFWNRLESYLEEHADVTFTHGICPDCKEEHYPGLGKKKKRA